MQQLQTLRKKVEAIDKKIIELLAVRFITTKQIQNIKRESNIPIRQKKRERELLSMYRRFAQRRNIPVSLIQKIYTALFSYSKKTGIMKRTKK